MRVCRREKVEGENTGREKSVSRRKVIKLEEVPQHTVTSLCGKERRERRRKRGKVGGRVSDGYYQYAPLNDTCGGAYFIPLGS